MKTRFLTYVAALGIISGCEGMLDKYPLAQMSPETFFSTENELEAFSNTFYTVFPSTSIYSESVDNYTQLELPEELRGARIIPASGSGWTWGALRNYNTLLENSVNCPDLDVRSEYNALARFFRAYFYFEKVKRFGDVPWYDTQLGSDDPALYKPRDSREYVMQKMIEDIDYAIGNLPAERSLYRITRWTALALKSRFCLFEGTFRKYHDVTYPEHDWQWYLQQAASAAEEFILNSGYTIYKADGPDKSYLNLFASENAIPDEIILARDYNEGLGVTHNANFYTLGQSHGRPGMTRKIVASYLMSDGSRFTDQEGWETMQFAQECRNRDPRLAQTIRTPGYTRIGASEELAPDLAVTVTGYQPVKFVSGTDSDAYNESYNDLPIFRTAEVYLNYAEAKAELGTLTQNDLEISVNKLRERVGMPDFDMTVSPDPYLLSPETGYPQVAVKNSGETRIAMILEIRRERTVELAQEGFRYYDIMRWKEGKTFEQPLLGMYFPGPGDYDLDGNGSVDLCLYVGDKPATTAKLSMKINQDIILTDGESGYVSPHYNNPGIWDEERDYLFPIPTDDRSLTMGALTQNPGWDDGLDF